MYEQEAVNQMFSFTVNGAAMAIEVVTKLTPAIVHFFASIAKYCKDKGVSLMDEHGLLNHEIPYCKLLRRGGGLECFEINEKDLQKFKDAAQSSPIFFNASCYDHTHEVGERIFTISVGTADAKFANMIIEQNDISVVKAGSVKVSSVDPEIAKNMPPIPGVDELDPEQVENSWSEFFDKDGQVKTPEQVADEKNRPTQPESSTHQSERSSGQHKKDESQTRSPQTPRAGESTVITEHLDEVQKIKEAERAAKENVEIGAAEAENPYKEQYQLLDKLKADCEYYLGNGNRAEKHLSKGSVDAQIKEMRQIYDSLPEKPEWLTAEQIDNYEKQMMPEKAVETLMDDLTPATAKATVIDFNALKKTSIRQQLEDAKTRHGLDKPKAVPTPTKALEPMGKDEPIKAR